jgi:AcrR family transcriptional regulator
MAFKSGDIKKITIRRIAEEAGVGVGLINHYFETKDNLIEVCVQKIKKLNKQ